MLAAVVHIIVETVSHAKFEFLQKRILRVKRHSHCRTFYSFLYNYENGLFIPELCQARFTYEKIPPKRQDCSQGYNMAPKRTIKYQNAPCYNIRRP